MQAARVFERSSLVDSPTRQGWSFVGSFVLQIFAVAVLILIPILDTYEIDLTAWARSTFRLAVPPPPPPPAPAVQPAARPAKVRYEPDLRAPAAIPEQVALLDDVGDTAWPVAGVPTAQGTQGESNVLGASGVLGMILTSGPDLPLPPPIRVGGQIQNARLLHRVQPVYPEDAIQQQVSGVVKLEAIIGVDGVVRDLKLLEGHPMLATAAIDAVSQWRYRPTRLNGIDVEVVTLIDVRFNLTVIDPKELKQLRRGKKPR